MRAQVVHSKEVKVFGPARQLCCLRNLVSGNALLGAIYGLPGAGPLNRFMAASNPWVTQTATACDARIRASSITGRSELRNRVSTKSEASACSWSPIPIRRRGN